METGKESAINREKLLATLPKISPKQKKEEIVDAYNRLLEKYKEGVFSEEQTLFSEKGVEKEEYSKEKLLKETADFKENFSGFVGKLENRVIAEFEKLKNIQENIELRKKELEKIYDVEISLNHLGFLLRENKIMRGELALEREETKRKWEEEKKEREMKAKWEGEEQRYSFAFRKQKAEDELKKNLEEEEKKFTSKVQEKDKILAEREKALKEQEEEFKNLRFEISSLPQKIEKVKKEVEERVAKQLKNEYETQARFQEEKYKSSLNLANLEIKNLKETIIGFEAEIKNSTRQLEAGKNQMQEIVLKVIEGKSLPMSPVKEKEEKAE